MRASAAALRCRELGFLFAAFFEVELKVLGNKVLPVCKEKSLIPQPVNKILVNKSLIQHAQSASQSAAAGGRGVVAAEEGRFERVFS